MKIMVECKKLLKEHIDTHEILSEMCLRNNLKLSDTDKNEILESLKEYISYRNILGHKSFAVD